MDPSWALWVAVLVGWPLAGLGLAYVFGAMSPNDEAPEDTTLTPRISYLRRARRREAAGALTETRFQRAAGSRSRH
jgi:hypothetical protein